MSTIAGGPPPVSHSLPVHGPIGKPAVGLESVADKGALLPPVEDATETERLHQRDVVVKLSGDPDREQRESQEREQSDEEAAEAVVLAGAKPHQARQLAEFDAPVLPPGSLFDQSV